MRALRYLPVLIMLLALVVAIPVVAGPNMGMADGPTAGTFIPCYGSNAAGSMVPATVVLTATTTAQFGVTAWDWNGTAWSKVWPTSSFGLAAGDTCLHVPAGTTITLSLEYQSIDAFYVSEATAEQIIWLD